jgi:hypothetical protein
MESIDDNLKNQPKQFWDNVFKFMKDRGSPAQFQVSSTQLTKHDETANEFSEHFCRIGWSTLLKIISNLKLFTQSFQAVWVEAVTAPVFKKTAEPLLVIIGLLPFSMLFLRYLNLPFVSIFPIVLRAS